MMQETRTAKIQRSSPVCVSCRKPMKLASGAISDYNVAAFFQCEGCGDWARE